MDEVTGNKRPLARRGIGHLAPGRRWL